MSLQEQLGVSATFSVTPALSPSSPCPWMPLEGTAQLWAAFAGTFLTYPAFTTASAVFSALSLEAGALQHYEHACHSRFNGDDLHARAACEQAVHDLQDASSQWMSALYWLERLTGDQRHPLDEQECASLRSLFSEATKHLQRVGVLTQQVQEACVLGYQQHGMLRHEEEEGRGMNRDRHARSGQPVQRLGARPPRGESITYQDSRGHLIVCFDEGDDDDVWPPPVPNSSVRYDMLSTQGTTRYQFHPDQVQSIPARRSAQPVLPAQTARGGVRSTEAIPAAPRRKKRGWFRAHPLLWLGIGMLLMLGLWQGLTALGTWWQLHQDDVTYGRPRTAQYDQVVGHHDDAAHPTHFLALNLNAQVLIIELPGGESSKAKIYQGPHIYGPHADLDPVTLSFRDVDGDGTVDMIVTVQGTQIIYLNQNGQFVEQQSR